MAERKICVVTGSRAEYGLLYWLLKEIEADHDIALQLVVTGMHLAPQFGLTVGVIEDDGFAIDERVDMVLDGDTGLAVAQAMGRGVIGMAETLARLRPDILVVLGDRFEILAAAQAAMMLGVPIAHVHGGEVTEGAVDDAIRHAITKMAHLHFAAAEPYRQRIIQLGEAPERVFTVGALGLDNIERIRLPDPPELEKTLGFELGEGFFLLTYHPETLGAGEPGEIVREVLGALDAFPDRKVLITGVNADAGNRGIARALADYAKGNAGRVCLRTSLGQLHYLSALKHCALVIGNSSSGIIEAPALGTPTVNIDDRQKGRLRASSVVDCPGDRADIVAAIHRCLEKEAAGGARSPCSPYGTSGACERIRDILKNVPLDLILVKPFHDLPVA